MDQDVINVIREESKSKSSDAIDKIMACWEHMKKVGTNGSDIDAISGYTTILVTQTAKEEVAELLELHQWE